jgi:hypothetical protein
MIMDKSNVTAGIMLFLAGLTGLIYGVGINLQSMVARGATDYSFITVYIIEWLLILIAGLVLAASGLRRK